MRKRKGERAELTSRCVESRASVEELWETWQKAVCTGCLGEGFGHHAVCPRVGVVVQEEHSRKSNGLVGSLENINSKGDVDKVRSATDTKEGWPQGYQNCELVLLPGPTCGVSRRGPRVQCSSETS